jgi:uncharacterized membrane protein
MQLQRQAGIFLVCAGILGYGTGIFVPYPGRAFSITLLMVGIALAAIASASTEWST